MNCIKTSRLYREEFATFDDYCFALWNIGKSHASRIMNAAEVVSNITTSPTGEVVTQNTELVPVNERQVRPLTDLETDEQSVAWNKAVEIAGGHQPTSAQVSEAVQIVKPSIFAVNPPLALTDTLSQDTLAQDTPNRTDWDNEWRVETMEAALRAIQDDGIVQPTTLVRCIAGCRVSLLAGKYVHEDDCPLGNALGMI